MSLKTTAIGCAFLFIGIFIGRFSSSYTSSDSAPNNAGSAENSSPNGTKTPSSRGLLTPLANASGLRAPDSHGELVVIPTSLLEQARNARAITSLEQDLFSPNDEVEKFLQISENEKSAMQHEWRSLRKLVKELEATTSKNEDLADGSVKITVPDTSEKMNAISDEFTSITSTVLDANRAKAFLSMKGITAALKNNSGERSYMIKVESIGNGRWRYKMTTKSVKGLNKTWIGESIPPAIRHLTDAARIDPNLNPPEVEE